MLWSGMGRHRTTLPKHRAGGGDTTGRRWLVPPVSWIWSLVLALSLHLFSFIVRSGFAPDPVHFPPHTGTGRNHLSPYHVFRPTAQPSSSRIIPMASITSLHGLSDKDPGPATTSHWIVIC